MDFVPHRAKASHWIQECLKRSTLDFNKHDLSTEIMVYLAIRECSWLNFARLESQERLDQIWRNLEDQEFDWVPALDGLLCELVHRYLQERIERDRWESLMNWINEISYWKQWFLLVTPWDTAALLDGSWLISTLSAVPATDSGPGIKLNSQIKISNLWISDTPLPAHTGSSWPGRNVRILLVRTYFRNGSKSMSHWSGFPIKQSLPSTNINKVTKEFGISGISKFPKTDSDKVTG